MRTRGKVSTQIIKDVQSEIFRLSLTSLLKKVQPLCQDFFKSPTSKLVGSVHTALEAMEEDHRLRLSEDRYQEHLHCLQKAHLEMLGYDLPILLFRPLTVPKVTKGEWYKCTAAGHFFFKPAQYQCQETHACPECSPAKP